MFYKKTFYVFAALLSVAITADGQSGYSKDRVYTANQVSNSVSVIDPASNRLLGEIPLGNPYPNVLSPLYRGQSLVHGLRYAPQKKMLAVVSIGSNAVTLISTQTNQVIQTIYVGRSPHEPTFTPDGKQVWVSVRGEAYISVIDVDKRAEIKRIAVADGPGMVSFSPDGATAYVCSSFTPELDVVNTSTFEVVKRIPVTSPFSPNIFTSPDGAWVAMTHKDVGKVTVIDARKLSVYKVINTGAITNHVTFTTTNNKTLMLVTVGGENKVRIFDVNRDFLQTDSITVGTLPHGLWASRDGKLLYVGLEYADQVQAIDLEHMHASHPVKIGQSPQALVYADNAVEDKGDTAGLSPLQNAVQTQTIVMKGVSSNGLGRIAVRPIGLTDLVEQIFGGLTPAHAYVLALTHSKEPPFTIDVVLNSFTTDPAGKYMGQSTGLVKTTNAQADVQPFTWLLLQDKATGKVVLQSNVTQP